MSIEQNSDFCKVKIFQLQYMSNAIRCIDQRFAFKNSRISCLASIFNLNNLRTTVLYAKKSVAGGEIRWVMYLFFKPLIRTNVLVVKVSRSESGDLGSFPDEFWKSLPRLGHFAWHCARHRAVSALTRALFILLCSLKFLFSWISSVSISRWQSCNLNKTIRPPLFWRTWTRARASTCPRVLAWDMGRDYSDCRASELTHRQVSGFVYSLQRKWGSALAAGTPIYQYISIHINACQCKPILYHFYQYTDQILTAYSIRINTENTNQIQANNFKYLQLQIMSTICCNFIFVNL